MSAKVTSFNDDLIRAVHAGVILRFQNPEPIGELRRVLHVHRKVVWPYVANIAYAAYLRIPRVHDFPVVFEKRLCLFQKRIEAADEVITSVVATIKFKIAFRAREDKSFPGWPFVTACQCAAQPVSCGLTYR